MNAELREKIVNQGRALYEKAQTIAALQAEVQEGAEALLRTHRILSAKEAENAALREIVQAVADADPVSDEAREFSEVPGWLLVGIDQVYVTKARELLRKSSEEHK